MKCRSSCAVAGRTAWPCSITSNGARRPTCQAAFSGALGLCCGAETFGPRSSRQARDAPPGDSACQGLRGDGARLARKAVRGKDGTRGALRGAGSQHGREQMRGEGKQGEPGETGCQKSSTEHVAFLRVLRGRIDSARRVIRGFRERQMQGAAPQRSGRDGGDEDGEWFVLR